MTNPEVEVQPVQDSAAQSQAENLSPSENAIPEHKSAVRVDPNALTQTGKYGKLDTVHMQIFQAGARSKGTFTVYASRLDSTGSYVEYQLKDASGRLHRNGAWIRERDLKPN